MRDLDEIAALIEPLIPGLRRYAVTLLHDSEAADDLVQDTLERALSRWRLRRQDGDLRAWLFAIERNLFLTLLRKQRRRGAHLGEDVLATVSAAGLPQEQAFVGRDIQAALDALPEDQRSVLLLVAVEGLSYEAVSSVLDVPVGTVMSRLSRARDKIRRMMQSETAPLLRRVK